jgi:hypothetical protein
MDVRGVLQVFQSDKITFYYAPNNGNEILKNLKSKFKSAKYVNSVLQIICNAVEAGELLENPGEEFCLVAENSVEFWLKLEIHNYFYGDRWSIDPIRIGVNGVLAPYQRDNIIVKRSMGPNLVAVS